MIEPEVMESVLDDMRRSRCWRCDEHRATRDVGLCDYCYEELRESDAADAESTD